MGTITHRKLKELRAVKTKPLSPIELTNGLDDPSENHDYARTKRGTREMTDNRRNDSDRRGGDRRASERRILNLPIDVNRRAESRRGESRRTGSRRAA